jgi:hypothetical protein
VLDALVGVDVSVSYLIREVSGGYEVTKWEEWGGKRPNASYSVRLNREGWRECSCSGGTYHGYCKHVSMVRVWLREGKPCKIPIVVGLGPWGWGL